MPTFLARGVAADAYLVAFRVPNLFRDLFAEGALSSAFITVFARTTEPARSQELAKNVLAVITLIVGGVCALLFIFAPEIVTKMAGDFARTPGKLELTIALTRLMVPFLYFASSAALAMGILNSNGSFFVPAMGAAAFNLGNIIFGGGFAYLLKDRGPMGAIWGFGIGTLVGGFLQWCVQWPNLRGFGFAPLAGIFGVFSPARLRTAFRDPALKEIFRLMTPAVLAVAAVQINVMVDTYFASSLQTGSVAWLSFSFRIMHFPMGVFGVALSTAALPRLSRLVKEGQSEAFAATLEEALKWSLILAVGSTAGLIVFREPLVSLIYQHGRFSAHDTVMTGYALASFAFGLLAFNGSKIFVQAFYAMGSVLVPSVISFVSIVMNYLLDIWFAKIWGHAGLALSTSLTSFVNMLWLWLLLRGKINFRLSPAFFRTLWASCLGAAAIAAFHFLRVPQTLMLLRSQYSFWAFVAATLVALALAGAAYVVVLTVLTPDGKLLFAKLRSRFALRR